MHKTLPLVLLCLISSAAAAEESSPANEARAYPWSLYAGVEPGYSSANGITLALPFTLQYELFPRFSLGATAIGAYVAGSSSHFLYSLGPSFNFRAWDFNKETSLVLGGGYLLALETPHRGDLFFATIGVQHQLNSRISIEPYLKATTLPEWLAGLRLRIGF